MVFQFLRRLSTGRLAGLSGCPSRDRQLELVVKIASQSEKTIHFHAEYPWTPGSAVPILAVSRKYLQRGTIAVRTPVTVRSRFKSSGLRRLNASVGSSQLPGPVPEAESTGRDDRESDVTMDVHAFAFNEPGARLELFTEPLAPLPEAGVIREAVLATSIDPNGMALHRLRLDASLWESPVTGSGSARGDVTGASSPRRHGCRADRVRDGPFNTATRGEPGLEILYDPNLDYVVGGRNAARGPG